jgi:Helix-turn-helix domain
VSDTDLTVAEVAATFRVKPDIVLGWIGKGQLAAVNVASAEATRKPRWRIDRDALEMFKAARRAQPAPVVVRRRKRQQAVVEYF